jgi:hypothetical protein
MYVCVAPHRLPAWCCVQAGPEEESTFNEAVYGQPPPPASSHLPEASALGPPLRGGPAAGGGAGGGGGGAAAAPAAPLRPGQEVPGEVLASLRQLPPDAFLTLLSNFYRGLKGRFKVPIFAHQELDLFTVRPPAWRRHLVEQAGRRQPCWLG